ncbi:TonB-dependent receptor domain-containing protein [Vibrio splendidus]|uniref:TonB-dependent receptor domain-containing protein n=1 Tax=Vibrio splendidus TaxID=29497 RepID=UPI00080E3326|nr:TonB-dependent receptor [Vibrio splendidus]OCH64464.1 Vitamin B12 transporter BtuB [Vibrio splendidus]
MNKSLLAVAVASLLSPISNLHAQEVSTDETMVVTANRFEQDIKSTLAPVSVITRQDIASLRAQSTFDVLKTLPGVEVNSLGSKSNETSIFIRGTASKHTLVLLDGVRLNSATAGGASIGLIPVSAIEKIEVVRGPRAAVYGSDAVGGVISISTVPTSGSVHEATLATGSNNSTQQTWRSVGDISDSTRGSFFYNKEKSDGYRVYEGAASGEKSGYESEVILGSLNHQINEKFALFFTGFSQNSASEYADTYSGPKKVSEVDAYSFSSGVKYSEGAILSSLEFGLMKNVGADGNADGTTAKTEISSKRESVSWVNTYVISPDFLINGGIDYYKEYADRGAANTTSYDKETKDNKAVFITGIASFLEGGTIEASARYDDDSAFGDHSTWNLAAGYYVLENVEAIASIGTAFKAPTFNDLYWPGSGNPDLKPETSESKEVGFRGYHDLLDWSVVGYQSDIEDMIDWAPTPAGPWVPSNVNNVEIKGLEVEISFEVASISNRFVADWKDPKDKKDNSQLIRRAKENFKWVSTYQFENFDLGLSVNYTGDRKDKSGETLKAYTTADLGLGYQVTDNFSTDLRLSNIFDEEYKTALGANGNYYLGEGRAYYFSASYQF